jgi:nucleoside-diphosphate-sugar epimerase
MTALKVLFIGGSGQISSACSQRAVELGIDLYVLNRGRTSIRPLPAQAHLLEADIRDPSSARAAIGEHEFDAVVDFVAFTPEHVQADIDLFAGRTGQFVFISSASAYQKPVGRLPIVESTPLRNPIWPYSQAKIACEELLVRAYREDGFPATIVRPSHTYDRANLPFEGGWTVVERMRRGKEVVVHGDGTSLWTLTHHVDFAKAFVGLLGHPQAIGESFHITSDEVLPGTRSTSSSGPRPARSRASCTWRQMRSSPRTSGGAARCWATRRTRSSSTTPRSVPWSPTMSRRSP